MEDTDTFARPVAHPHEGLDRRRHPRETPEAAHRARELGELLLAARVG